VNQIVVELMVELISSMVALVIGGFKKRRWREFFSLTCRTPQCNAVEFLRKFFGVKDTARRRLDRLVRDKGRIVAAQTLECVGGEQIPFLMICRILNTLRPPL